MTKKLPITNYQSLITNLIRRIRLRTWIVLGVLLLTIPIALVAIYNPSPAHAEWFNDAWTYRQPWSFTHNAALTDRRVSFAIANTNTLVTAGKLQASCNDIRFTDAGGKILRIQLTGTCNSASTTYDVIIPSVLNGLNSGFLYYGNPGAGTVSEDVSSFTSLSPSGGAPAFGAEVLGDAPQLYYSMDEGVDNTCSGGSNDICDATTGANDGAISNGTAWQTDDKCIAGKCLWFDGIDDVVTTTQTARINISGGQLASGFTFSTWVKPNGAGEGAAGQIFAKGTNTWLRVDTLSSGSLDVEGNLDYVTADANVNVSTAIKDNSWNQIQMTFNSGANTISIYINGKLGGTSGAGTGGLVSDTNNLLIGGNTTNNFKGFTDEFKIYKQAKTITQIQADYAAKGTNEGISARFGQVDTSFLNDGLVGYWKLDETATPALDSSGNGQSGTWTAIPTSAAGKFGNAISLASASSQYITVTDSAPLSPTSQVTISAWINPTTNVTSRSVVVKDTAYRMTTNASSQLVCEVYSGGTWQTAATGATTLATGSWQLTSCTYDGQTVKAFVNGIQDGTSSVSTAINDSAAALEIGRNVSTNYFNGAIDEARVYNRALSGKEIQSLYNWAPGPIGYWKMDENTGQIVNDISGTNASGTLGNTSSVASDDPTWTNGKFGPALLFDGVNDFVKTVDLDAYSFGNSTTDVPFSVEAWVYATNGVSRYIVSKNNEWYFRLGSDGLLKCQQEDQSTTGRIGRGWSVAFTTNGWYHIACTYNGNSLSSGTKIYVNGVQKDDGNELVGSYVAMENTINPVVFGDVSFFQGKIDDVRIYNYVRTPQQIVEDMNGGHPAGGSPVGSQLIYWSMDEQSGSGAGSVHNTGNGGSTYDGNNAGAAWLTNATCKVNGCLNFDTTTDNVSAGDPLFIDGLTGFSTSFWINPQTLATNKMILSKANNITERVFQIKTDDTTAAKLKVMISSLASDTSNYCVTAASVLTASTWQHVTIAYDGTAPTGNDQRVKVFINGKLSSCTVTGTIPTSLVSATTSNLKIGQGDDATPTALLAYLDEVKIYNSALTSDQVIIEANFGGGIDFSTGYNESSTTYGGPGGNAPVGLWNLDENVGQSVNDTSGTGANGFVGQTSSSESSDPSWDRGKFGSGLRFDGNDDGVLIADNDTLDMGISDSFTVTAWIKRTGQSNFGNPSIVASKINTGASGAGYHLMANASTTGCSLGANTNDGAVCLNVSDGVDTYSVTSPNNSQTADSLWHYIVGVFDNSSETNTKIYIDGIPQTATRIGVFANVDSMANATDLCIGKKGGVCIEGGTSNSFNGSIDQVKIFKYALSQAQISYDYNRGRPVAWWQFDECSGAVANDNTGNGNTGTITPGGVPNTDVGTCTSGNSAHMWNDGAVGKFNNSLGFDGTDDYVTIAHTFGLPLYNNGTTSSISLWAKNPDTTQLNKAFYSQGNSTTDTPLYFIGINDTDGTKIRIFVRDDGNVSLISASTTESVITDNNWHNIVLTDNNGVIAVYIDGVSRTLTSSTYTRGTLTLNRTSIGAMQRIGISSVFNGQIDDVRVYNYVLTAAQVRKLYNNDAGSRYGPASGIP